MQGEFASERSLYVPWQGEKQKTGLPQTSETLSVTCFFMEAAPGFEPGMKDLQSSALPLGYAATKESITTRILSVKAQKSQKIQLNIETFS